MFLYVSQVRLSFKMPAEVLSVPPPLILSSTLTVSAPPYSLFLPLGAHHNVLRGSNQLDVRIPPAFTLVHGPVVPQAEAPGAPVGGSPNALAPSLICNWRNPVLSSRNSDAQRKLRPLSSAKLL